MGSYDNDDADKAVDDDDHHDDGTRCLTFFVELPGHRQSLRNTIKHVYSRFERVLLRIYARTESFILILNYLTYLNYLIRTVVLIRIVT